MLLLIPKFQHLQWMESTALLGCSTWWNGTSADVKIARSKRMSWLTAGIVFAVHTTCRKCRKNTKKKHPDTEETWDTWVMLVHTSVKHLVFQQRNTSGLALEYYQSHDANWFTPSQYFLELVHCNLA